jgi:hypothetical protein
MAIDYGSLPAEHEALAVYSIFGGGALAGFAAFVIYTLVFFGALSMKNLRRRGLAIAAGVLAVIPCLSPCYLLALPAGIWALVVLGSRDVKDAFR